MFPGTFGFQWTPGYLIFLTLFYCAVGVIGVTLMRSIARAVRDYREGKHQAIAWKSDFSDLSPAERRCRHDLAGQVERTCPNAFDCRMCTEHDKLVAAAPQAAGAQGEEISVAGMDLQPGVLYHRGHTAVRLEEDGDCVVSLDPLAARLVGKPDDVRLPEQGSELHANGCGWRMRKNGTQIRVLAPIDGKVVATGGPDDGWYLKLRPAGGKPNVRHLLSGSEAASWMTSEVERLQSLLGERALGATLADGGALVDDLPKARPDAHWPEVYGAMFLQP